MHNSKRIILTIILIATTVLVTIFSLQQQAQDKSKLQKDEPTHIQEGVMTEKQRKHSKLYNRSLSKGEPLTYGTDDVRRIIGLPFITENSLEESLSSQENFLKTTCQSETVVIAEIKSKNAQLSEDNNSIFTDYEVVVKEVFKNNSSSDVRVGMDITITRSGGAVKIKNRIIEVIDKSYKTLNVGRKYLFFLNYLSDSNSFNAASVKGTFEISGDKIKRLDDADYPYEYTNRNLQNIADDIRMNTQQCSQNKD